MAKSMKVGKLQLIVHRPSCRCFGGNYSFYIYYFILYRYYSKHIALCTIKTKILAVPLRTILQPGSSYIIFYLYISFNYLQMNMGRFHLGNYKNTNKVCAVGYNYINQVHLSLILQTIFVLLYLEVKLPFHIIYIFSVLFYRYSGGWL